MQALSQTVRSTAPIQHLVQFYNADPAAWAKTVGRYLADGLRSGEAVLVIATPEHRKTIARQLASIGCDPESPKYAVRVVFLDAGYTLAKFTVAGKPDRERFRDVMGAEVQRLLSATQAGGVRAYGEMVGVLWSAKQFSAAVELEEFWNGLLRSTNLKLFCGYPIDVFADDVNRPYLDALVCAHTHVVPTSDNGELQDAIMRAASEVAGMSTIEALIEPDRHPNTYIPPAEAAIWGLRDKLPAVAGEVIASARRYFQAGKRFRALIEHSSDAISLIDAQAYITFASGSTSRVLGYRPDEVVGRNAFEFVHPEDRAKVQRTVVAVRKSAGIPVYVRARILAKGGDWRWAECTFTNLLDDPDVGAIVANYRDITERKAFEEKQKRHAEELARNNAELESFAYAATHDLREPLRTVSAFTQLLLSGDAPPEQKERYSKFILDAVAYMSQMIDDLLQLTRIGTNHRSDSVDLGRMVEQAVQSLEQPINQSGASIECGPLPCLFGNESELTLLMQNLLGNAMKYRGNDAPQIRVSAERAGDVWVVRVRDNGIGIAPAYREQIFGLFKRLQPRSVPGTGIGLAISKKIVEGMGGRIWVESQPGQGSTFCFTAPAAPES